MRRQLRTRSRMVICPSPSRLGGRVSSRTVCGCWSCNSAASSQVMTRSSASMNCVRQLSSVVLPEPVPPDTRVLTRQRPMTRRISAPSGVMLPKFTSCSSVSLSFLNLRIVRAGPSMASGGTITLTREPSGRRASQIGDDFVDPTADLADDALADVQELLIVAEPDAGLLDLAFDFDVGGAGSVHHDVGDVVAREQRLERPVAEHVVADVVEQLFLLGDRHDDVLDRDDLVDDVADFLARGIGVELGELSEVDGLDQRAEDGALDLVIVVGVTRVDRGRHQRLRVVWHACCACPASAHRRSARQAPSTASVSGRPRPGLPDRPAGAPRGAVPAAAPAGAAAPARY